MNTSFKRILKMILLFLMFVVLFSSVILLTNFFKPKNNIDQDNKNEFLFLMAGVDDKGEEFGTRTDTMMLVKANLNEKKIDLISIPRDSLVNINGYMDKINAAHSYGGIDLTIETVRDFLGIDLTNYVVIPFDAVVDGIDALGGIDIDVSEDIASAMDITPGTHRFTGSEALDYVRFRKGYANADLGRIATQQDFVMQFIHEATRAKNIPKLPIVYMSMSDKIKTNMSFSQMSKLALAFRGIDKDDINQVRLEGEVVDIDGISYYDIYDYSIEDVRNNFLSNFSY